MVLLLITQRDNLILRYFQPPFIFKLSDAAINLRMTVSDKSEGIWMDAMVAYVVTAEDGRDRLQRMSVITG
jgi:hypothetical protein